MTGPWRDAASSMSRGLSFLGSRASRDPTAALPRGSRRHPWTLKVNPSSVLMSGLVSFHVLEARVTGRPAGLVGNPVFLSLVSDGHQETAHTAAQGTCKAQLSSLTYKAAGSRNRVSSTREAR